MSGSSLPYRLRPNKAVDRELFLSLLMRLTPKLGLEKYHYVGLGGPFLEDFRLLHSRIGIGRKRSGRTVGRLTWTRRAMAATPRCWACNRRMW